MNVVIRQDTPADFDAIDEVISHAFGRMDEAQLVRNLRDGGRLLLSLLAEAPAGIVGHVAFSRILIETVEAHIPAVSLAPLAVRPEFQRRGLGSLLVHDGLQRLRQQESILIVLGHPEYYPRFGFHWELAQPILHPFNVTTEWMALELQAGALAGIRGRVKYAGAFGLATEWTI